MCAEELHRIWIYDIHLGPSVGLQSTQCHDRKGIRGEPECVCEKARGEKRVCSSVPLPVLLKRAEDADSLCTPTGKQLHRATFILTSNLQPERSAV